VATAGSIFDFWRFINGFTYLLKTIHGDGDDPIELIIWPIPDPEPYNVYGSGLWPIPIAIIVLSK